MVVVRRRTDRSYAVRFYRGDAEDYIRVDADLWTKPDGSLIYARPGRENAIWVPIVEKAFAIARQDKALYISIGGGGNETRSDLRYTRSVVSIPEVYTKDEVATWFNNQTPDGPIKTAVEDGARTLLHWIDQQQQAGVPMTTGAVSRIENDTVISTGRAISWAGQPLM